MSSLIPSTTSFLNATAAFIAPSPIAKSRSPLSPTEGAPLSGDTTLIPNKYLNEKRDEDTGYPPSPLKTESQAQTTSLNPHPSRSVPAEIPSLVRSPPSTLLDAPARAAMSLPNSQTAAAQARAVRGGEVKTPEYEVDEDVYSRAEDVPLLAPIPLRPSLSRASSAASTASNRGILRRIFIDRSTTPSQHLTRPTFPPPSLSTYSPMSPAPLSLWAKLNLLFVQTTSIILSTYFLVLVVLWAVAAEMAKCLPKWIWPERPRKFPWDDEEYWKKEGKTVSKDPAFYAKQVGMDIEHQTVETEDGYYLKMHRVIDPDAQTHSDGRGGFPVLILHGLFQSSGSFVTSEDRSLAFWLAREGKYQVYLGNTRGVFDMGHRTFSRNDPRFWDWTIRELAMYDLPALVEHVCRETGYDKIAFIGHSQGNGLAFISLSLGMCPSLGSKLSVFIALAPAVYAGTLTTGFPFTTLNKMDWPTWKRFFGVLDFIPLMRWAYDYAPPRMFASLGYIMFAFLFSWTDTNWLHRRKTKMFRFTPTPVSSASIFWWCGKGGFADRKCTLDDSLPRWFDKRFPALSVYHGGRDFLVFADPLLERLKEKEKDVKVIKVTKLEDSEHCDFYWAAEAVEWAYLSFLDDIESTRPRYPDEPKAPEGGTETNMS
ncbi:lipid particle protein [Cryptococcus neoformans var. grubii Br795]|uniref:sterol esterase n=1 Tax=Cryptococcus neoformans Tu259-1 TaxID=1230072 RepID=A0A854QM82_CRYNE|nr:lipid particle protein [Cryptococcus neoformans var. grubii Bt1]OWZ56744.1 lipid particle protein [Cryptococcus neoformans var. grubii AD1-83a]OWZ57949.1 lipid particle protein [Cryptococcus neoformans var. grubii 125.91]OXB39625.1 lipid particle protein [Cryptococcus neoformans var. grubii]OXC65531.1 lipid particle protein [Cryptococcus neoformans var. grubii MW-RSA852]OXG28954.1 lipid particle protein [Cryptococcus neoformans var. grubii Tu259-1]OXG35368.1 lipid particle protein [Cryptoc